MDEQTLRGVGGRRRTVRVGAGALVLAACGALVLAGCSGSRGESASGAGSTAEPGGQVAASAVPPSPGDAPAPPPPTPARPTGSQASRRLRAGRLGA